MFYFLISLQNGRHRITVNMIEYYIIYQTDRCASGPTIQEYNVGLRRRCSTRVIEVLEYIGSENRSIK